MAGSSLLAIGGLSADGHLGFGVAGMRLLAIASVGVLAAVLPGLARRCGVDPAAALWLGALNPLVLVHLLAGAHNDALMVALLAGGLAAATAGRPAGGAVLVSLATLVKAPAALGLLFVAAIWARQRPARWRWVRAGFGSGLAAAATLVAVTAVAGTGFGWVDALRTPVSASGWSLPGALDHLTAYLLRLPDPSLWRWLGTGLAIGAVGFVIARLRRFGPVYGLGLALTAIAVLGPTLRPWYLLWGLVPIAAAAPDGRARRLAAWTCAVAAMLVFPDGDFGPQPSQIALAVLGTALAAALLAVLHYHDQFPVGLLRRYRGTVSLGDGRLR